MNSNKYISIRIVLILVTIYKWGSVLSSTWISTLNKNKNSIRIISMLTNNKSFHITQSAHVHLSLGLYILSLYLCSLNKFCLIVHNLSLQSRKSFESSWSCVLQLCSNWLIVCSCYSTLKYLALIIQKIESDLLL